MILATKVLNHIALAFEGNHRLLILNPADEVGEVTIIIAVEAHILALVDHEELTSLLSQDIRLHKLL